VTFLALAGILPPRTALPTGLPVKISLGKDIEGG
jgi:hypothetical protein